MALISALPQAPDEICSWRAFQQMTRSSPRVLHEGGFPILMHGFFCWLGMRKVDAISIGSQPCWPVATPPLPALPCSSALPARRCITMGSVERCRMRAGAEPEKDDLGECSDSDCESRITARAVLPVIVPFFFNVLARDISASNDVRGYPRWPFPWLGRTSLGLRSEP